MHLQIFASESQSTRELYTYCRSATEPQPTFQNRTHLKTIVFLKLSKAVCWITCFYFVFCIHTKLLLIRRKRNSSGRWLCVCMRGFRFEVVHMIMDHLWNIVWTSITRKPYPIRGRHQFIEFCSAIHPIQLRTKNYSIFASHHMRMWTIE